MKYLLLINIDAAEAAASVTDMPAVTAEYGAFSQRIIESGELVAGDRLEDVDTATTVRIRGGEATLTDGPFAETKEQIGGYFVVDELRSIGPSSSPSRSRPRSTAASRCAPLQTCP